jgi:hypothetical protein
MGVATVLIGCLPTYQMIGLASPILLALLRLVQGLAMGARVLPRAMAGRAAAPVGLSGRPRPPCCPCAVNTLSFPLAAWS